MPILRSSNLVESDALPLTFGVDGIEPCTLDNPLNKLIQIEESEDADSLAVTAAKIDAVRRLVISVFDEGRRHPIDALAELYLIAYIINADLVGGYGLEEIAAVFDMTKQAFSKRLLQINKSLHVRSRNQKSDTAIATYSQVATAWHKYRAPGRKLAIAQQAQQEADKEAEAQRKELNKLQAEIDLYNKNNMTTDNTPPEPKKPNVPSAEGRARISAAQKARHAAKKAPVETPTSPVEPVSKVVEPTTKPKARKPVAKKAAPETFKGKLSGFFAYLSDKLK